MRRVIIHLFFLFVISSLPAHATTSQQFTASVKDYTLALDFPADWKINNEKNPFDLQTLSGNEWMTTGVFLLTKNTPSTSVTPESAFERHIADIGSKRENFKVLKTIDKYNANGNTIRSMLCQGERNESVYYYYFSLVEPENQTDTFAILLQTTFPDEWDKNEDTLKDIVASTTITKP